MNDQCRTVAVMLQENGIVRSINGHIIGRLATMDGLDFNALSNAFQQSNQAGEKDEKGGSDGHK